MSPPEPAASSHPRRTAARWISPVGCALLVSAFAHAGAAVTAGVILRATAEGPGERQEAVDIDVVAPVPSADEMPAPPGSEPAPRAKQRPVDGHPVATRTTAVRTHAAPSRPIGSFATDGAEPARFALAAGTVATQPSFPTTGTSSGSSRDGSPAGDAVADGDVSTPARLLAGSPLIYPATARRAEIEVDLPVEIVVDTSGRVRSAVGIARAGYGLDEAALDAIRRYHFSPALRDGHPVPVRMRWMVQFRLQ